MKILCVIDSLCSGGAQRQLVELSLGFKDKRHEVEFLTYHDIPFYNKILQKAGINISCIIEPNYLKRLFKMRRFIRQGKFECVLSFLPGANFICEIAGIPSRKWCLVVGERNASPNILTSFRTKIFCWFHHFSDYVVANSSTNMQMLRSVVPFLNDGKCKIIYNIVNQNIWKPIDDYVPRKNGKIKLVIAARHHPQKNLFGTIDAIASLYEEERQKLIVQWYGDSYEDSLVLAKEKIQQKGLKETIEILPTTHNISTIIKSCDAVGLFSFYEGLPNSLCEGMACGKPIVCSDVSDLPSFLGHQRSLLCDPNNIESICRAIRSIINMSNEELILIGNKNQVYAKKMFVKDAIVSEYLGLLAGRMVNT